MSFTAKNGTRGARQPGGPLLRLMNGVIARRIRKGGKLIGGTEGLVLTTIGAKSGERRSTPLVWFPGDDGSWLIVASAAGARRNPSWYYNIAAHPDQVQIQIEGRTIPVTAAQLHAPGARGGLAGDHRGVGPIHQVSATDGPDVADHPADYTDPRGAGATRRMRPHVTRCAGISLEAFRRRCTTSMKGPTAA